MQLAVLGMNHKTAPVEIRERFSISREDVVRELTCISGRKGVSEAVILSTCNRTEIYAMTEAEENGRDVLKKFYRDLGCRSDGADLYLYYYTGEQCIRHLFRVSASLDSLVIGEGQILSQVKRAYETAWECGATSTVMNILFHRAVKTGKEARAQTHISDQAVSVSYAAVKQAEKVMGGSLKHSAALIYGAGQMAELTIRNLRGRGIQKFYIANRHMDKAEALAAQTGGTAVPFDGAMEAAPDADVVLTSTGSIHYVVGVKETREHMETRAGRPLIFIDIAVPRDVDPDVAEIENVYLYNIDDLEETVEENRLQRLEEAKTAEKIVEKEERLLMERFRYLSFQPVMDTLSRRADKIRRREIKRASGKLGELTEKQQHVIDHMTHMIVRKVLREPMMRLNGSAGTDQETYYTDAMRRLFKLEIPKENDIG